jgi:hypothetical protein
VSFETFRLAGETLSMSLDVISVGDGLPFLPPGILKCKNSIVNHNDYFAGFKVIVNNNDTNRKRTRPMSRK